MGRKLKEINKRKKGYISGEESWEKYGFLLGVERTKFLELINERKFIAGKIRGRTVVYEPSIIAYLKKTPKERENNPPQIGLREHWLKDWRNHLSEKSTAVEIGGVLEICSKTISEFIKGNRLWIENFFRDNGRGSDVDEINPRDLAHLMKDMDE
ncbi:MAG: hypothetical protein ACRCZH_05940 [Cetobacterium sp.]